MRDELQQQIAQVCQDVFQTDTLSVELTRPDEQFGDFSTNIALKLAPQLGRKPRELAEELAVKLRETLQNVNEIVIAGPGFINFSLNDAAFMKFLAAEPAQTYAGQEVLVEFGDPNPFKAMHIGHLYSYIVGDAICSLLAAAGAEVRRLSYHGDVGLHVAKALWAMQQPGADQSDIGKLYAAGAQAYETDERAKAQIDAINVQVYAADPAI
ncbi:MAG TPA: arginine--tRNA ligase, partial [Candidatus Saccharimonadales bacterium]|nr:arginine--tRNA ligase [Candidatus Saccharimonadales bacterium]